MVEHGRRIAYWKPYPPLELDITLQDVGQVGDAAVARNSIFLYGQRMDRPPTNMHFEAKRIGEVGSCRRGEIQATLEELILA